METETYGDMTPTIEQFETLRITKNTKGYNWEIKVLKQKTETDEQLMDRLTKLNNEMLVRFGGQND